MLNVIFVYFIHIHTSHQPQKKKVVDVTSRMGRMCCRMISACMWHFQWQKVSK